MTKKKQEHAKLRKAVIYLDSGDEVHALVNAGLLQRIEADIVPAFMVVTLDEPQQREAYLRVDQIRMVVYEPEEQEGEAL